MLKIYMKQKQNTILYFVVMAAIYVLFAALFHEPIVAAIYPLIIAFIAGMVFFFYDYKKTKEKLNLINGLFEIGDISCEELPSDSAVANKYRELVENIYEKSVKRESFANKKMNDAIEYYTLWAHQIKTPIASMRLTISSEDSELARKISSDLLKIEQYVDMVLNYMRLDSTSTDYVIKEVKLDDIIRPVIKKYAGEFILRKLSIDYDEPDDMVLTDEKWLSFVLEQLISNALKYTRTGSIKIYKHDDKLVIEDTGMGIAASDLPRVFEKGYTGNIGREDKRASGIGLFLVKQVMDRLGHRIHIESEIDKGTRVYLDLNKSNLWVE